MVDIKLIREEPARFKKAAELKRIACDVDALLECDNRRRELQKALDALRHEQKETGPQMALYRNTKSPWYQQALSRGLTAEQIAAEANELQARLNEIKAKIKAGEDEERAVVEQFNERMLTIPQPADPEVPVGKDDTENVELRRVGEVPKLGFELKDHVELGKSLGIIDIERGVKLAGTRNYVLVGDGALLHLAVLRLAYDTMIERGYVPLTVPVLVNESVMYGTGYFPVGRDQAYLCERDEMSLVGTAEVPVTALHGEEMLGEAELPKRYVAMSPCFRREAGAAGKDTYGLYRIHLFDKVEQVVICANDEELSRQFHQEILSNAQAVMAKLEMPYRVVNVCTGDLGQGQVQKFDIETWMPSRGNYGETHSASRFYEFQARRLNLRYRDAAKKPQFCHTLNNTVIASPRILIPLLELNQQRDGSVVIPPALRPYMLGRERIEPKA